LFAYLINLQKIKRQFMFLFKKHTWLTTTLLLTLTACGGGSGSPSTGDTGGTGDSGDTGDTGGTGDTGDKTGPTVSNTTPAESSTEVSRNSTITATFNENILDPSVDASGDAPSFALTQSNMVDPITATSAVDNNLVTLTPNSDLSILTTYTATLSTAITDLSGNPLAADFSWSFTTVEGTWGTAEMIEDNAKNASTPQIAFDSSGNAIAVWSQNDADIDAVNNIWANRFDSSTAEWGTAELIEADAGDATSPQVTINSSGNAIAVWSQGIGLPSQTNIMSNRFDGTDWGTAESIVAVDSGDASSPQVAFDNSGNAIAVWSQSDGLLTPIVDIMTNRFDSTTAGWGTAESIEDGTGDAASPQVAFDSSGNAITVWSQNDGNVDNIMANRFDNTTVLWGTAVLIEGDDAGNAASPQVAFDSSGNAIAVWSQNDGAATDAVDNITANRFDGNVWGTAETIEADAGNAASPQIAFDNSGNAIAVWSQNNGAEIDAIDNIMANRFDGTVWGSAAESIEAGAGNAASPQVAFDSSGNAIAVWSQNNVAETPVDNIMVNRFNGNVWDSTAESIETDDTGSAASPQVALDSSGNAIAVWSQNDGDVDNIMANSFR
jgi:hypothetical protein